MRKKWQLLAAGLFVVSCGTAADLDEESVRTTEEQTLSFDEFRTTLPVDDSGRYIVEWDLLLDDEQLYDYWLELPSSHPGSLIINRLTDGSTPLQASTLTYCIDNSFNNGDKDKVEGMITTVVSNWSSAAGKTFSVTRNRSQDGTGCTNANNNVSFNVRKLSGSTSFGFFPGEARSNRELKIAGSHFNSTDFGGIMRHEFGHIYGFRHEHIRLCPAENTSYKELTRVDRPSIMHYPNVCGDGNAPLGNLSDYDKKGARCAYSGQCEWIGFAGAANDIGVSANGQHVWAIGNTPATGGFSIHRRSGSTWQTMPGAGVAIAVEPGGNAWVVNDQQSIFRYNGSTFVQVSGAARDIAVGANGKVWIIGNTADSGGYLIYRRDGSAWTPVGGAAVRISVDPSGNAWVVNDQQNIYKYNGSTFVQQSGGARDVSIGGDGSIWIIGNTPELGGYGIYERVSGEWFKTTGSALRISAGDGTPWIVNDQKGIWYNRWE